MRESVVFRSRCCAGVLAYLWDVRRCAGSNAHLVRIFPFLFFFLEKRQSTQKKVEWQEDWTVFVLVVLPRETPPFWNDHVWLWSDQVMGWEAKRISIVYTLFSLLVGVSIPSPSICLLLFPMDHSERIACFHLPFLPFQYRKKDWWAPRAYNSKSSVQHYSPNKCTYNQRRNKKRWKAKELLITVPLLEVENYIAQEFAARLDSSLDASPPYPHTAFRND